MGRSVRPGNRPEQHHSDHNQRNITDGDAHAKIALIVNWIALLGSAESGSVAVRRHGQGDQGTLSLDELVAQLRAEISSRT